MQILKLKNHFLYWIDRFDHILNPKEFQETLLIGFVSIQDLPITSELIKEYLREEEKIVRFAIESIKKFDGEIKNTKVRYSYLSTFSDQLQPLFNARQLKMFREIAQEQEYEPELNIKSVNEVTDLIEMGIRESFKVKFNIKLK